MYLGRPAMQLSLKSEERRREEGGLLLVFSFVPLLFSSWRFLRVQAGTATSRASCERIAGKNDEGHDVAATIVVVTFSSSSSSMDGRVLITISTLEYNTLGSILVSLFRDKKKSQ